MKTTNFIKTVTVLFIVVLTASCSSDDNNPEVNGIPYTIKFSVKVIDGEGKNLLSVPGEKEIQYGYSSSDISVEQYNNLNYNKIFDITRIGDEVFLNIEVSGMYKKGDYLPSVIINWGEQRRDYFDYELWKDFNGEMKCIKISNLRGSTWETGDSELPVFTLVKNNNYSKSPPVEPIVLMYPEKVKTDNQFAFNLFKKSILKDLSADNPNTFISPLSVNIALNMLINGAEGETKNEIQTTLEANGYSIDQINEHSKGLLEALTTVDLRTSVSIANSIWPDIRFPIKDDFIQTNTNYYDAVVHPIDFKSKDDAIRTVNNWCSDNTKGMIPAALDYLPDSVTLLLINALYFKGDWSPDYVFAKEATIKGPFYSSDGSKDNVDMMRNTAFYSYKSDSDAGYLKIPFGDGAFSMTIILPDESSSIQTVIDNIDKDPSWTTSDNMTFRQVKLSLPKFKMDHSYKMNEYILPEMGMKLPFDSINADFSGIEYRNPLFPMYVKEVIHKTAIDVDESGAAATAVSIIEMGADFEGGAPPVIIDFHVNRPFIFSICEESTGTILFIGKIEKLGN